MEELGINGTAAVILTLFVAGFVELVKYLFNREWEKAVVIVIAGASGGVGGWVLGFGILTGICAGFAASGAITMLKRVGNY